MHVIWSFSQLVEVKFAWYSEVDKWHGYIVWHCRASVEIRCHAQCEYPGSNLAKLYWKKNTSICQTKDDGANLFGFQAKDIPQTKSILQILHHTIIHTIGFMYFVITIHFAGGYFCCSELQPKVSYCWDLFSHGKRTDFVVNGWH